MQVIDFLCVSILQRAKSYKQLWLISAVVSVLIFGIMLCPVVVFGDSDSDLMEAIRVQDTKKVQALLSKGDKGTHVDAYKNSIERSYITPLMLAAGSSDSSLEIGEILIQKGATVNAKDMLGWTPLIYAAYYGQEAFASLLIEKGANPNAASNIGWTPLMYAAYSGQVGVGKLLIAKGAVVNLLSKRSETALSIAESRGWGDFADLLKKSGAK